MKIPNPFVLVLRVIAWPFLKLAMVFLSAIWFQAWVLGKMWAMGVDQATVNKLAYTFNEVNRKNGKPVAFQAYPVERATSDEEKTSGEAKP